MELHWVSRVCPVCGDKSACFLFRDRNRREGYAVETNLVQCSTCGMRYLTPIPSADDWMEQYETAYQQGPHQKVLSGLGRFVAYVFDLWSSKIWAWDMRLHMSPIGSGKGQRLLDIGCGSGEKLLHYYRRGFQVSGVDVSPTVIAEARKKILGDFRVGTFETADYPIAFFDVVRFDNVLEHIYNPKAFMQKVFCILRPGGMAYGFVPNGCSPTMHWLGKYSVSSWVPFHINLFTPETLSRLAQEVGLEASVVPISNPHWVALSVYQWLNRNQSSFDFADGFWLLKVIMALGAPVWWILMKFGMGEELCLKASRPVKSIFES